MNNQTAMNSAAITAVHRDVIQSHILNRLDGQTLASTSCANVELFDLCSENRLWKEICKSTWPSTADRAVDAAVDGFRYGHRSLYSDAFPISIPHSPKNRVYPNTSKLISAVDIYCNDVVLYSKVLSTDTISPWFLCSPFRIDLLEPKQTVTTPLRFDDSNEDGHGVKLRTCIDQAEAQLRVSWILIDPCRKRAVNVAGAKAVEARRHWLTNDIELRFATVIPGVYGSESVQCIVVVTCDGKDGGAMHVKELSMQVEDMDGKIVNGSDSLVVLDAVMEGQRCKSDGRRERERYREFLSDRIEFKERKQRRERNLDMVVIAVGVTVFVTFWVFLLGR